MAKDNVIKINYDTWKNGIARHPSIGMGDIVNIDIFSNEGVAKIDLAPTQIASSSDVTDGDTDAFQCCAIQAGGSAVFGTDEGDAFVYNGTTVTENNGTTGANFQHAVEWKGYTIFAQYNNVNDRMELTAYSEDLAGDDIEYQFVSMPTDSLSTGNGDFRFARGALTVGDDDILYVASGRYVGSLLEKAGQNFNPTDSNTYTWNNQALDLKEEYEIDSMINFNDFLLISAGNPDTRSQALFPWDRVSSSFNYPTILNDGVAAAMYSKENLAYFLNGQTGRFMATNRSVVEELCHFKNITFTTPDAGIYQKAGTVAVLDDVFYIGTSTNEESANKSYPHGLYKVKGTAYTRCTISTDEDGETGKLLTHFVVPFQYNKILVGWETENYSTSATDYGVDEFGKNGYRYTGYKAYFESPFYTIGNALDKGSLQQVEVDLAKPLATDQAIRVSYRKNLSDDWTIMETFDYDTYGGVVNFNGKAGIIDATKVQFKVELTTGSSSTTTPELLEVRIF